MFGRDDVCCPYPEEVVARGCEPVDDDVARQHARCDGGERAGSPVGAHLHLVGEGGRRGRSGSGWLLDFVASLFGGSRLVRRGVGEMGARGPAEGDGCGGHGRRFQAAWRRWGSRGRLRCLERRRYDARVGRRAIAGRLGEVDGGVHGVSSTRGSPSVGCVFTRARFVLRRRDVRPRAHGGGHRGYIGRLGNRRRRDFGGRRGHVALWRSWERRASGYPFSGRVSSSEMSFGCPRHRPSAPASFGESGGVGRVRGVYARVYSRARYVSGRVGTLSVKCGGRPRPVGDPDVGAKSRKLKVAGA